MLVYLLNSSDSANKVTTSTPEKDSVQQSLKNENSEQKENTPTAKESEISETAYLFVSTKDKTKVDVYLEGKKIGPSSHPLQVPIGTHTFVLKNPITGTEKSVSFTVSKTQRNKIAFDDL